MPVQLKKKRDPIEKCQSNFKKKEIPSVPLHVYLTFSSFADTFIYSFY